MLIECPHRNAAGECVIASQFAGRGVVPWKNVCETCVQCAAPQQPNYVTASIAVSAWKIAGDIDRAMKLRDDLRRRGLFVTGRSDGIIVEHSPIPVDGPGARLHRRLAELGYVHDDDCPCLHWVRQMNHFGAEWSRKHVHAISEAMITEFRRRNPNSLLPTRLLLFVSKRLILASCREWDSRNEI